MSEAAPEPPAASAGRATPRRKGSNWLIAGGFAVSVASLTGVVLWALRQPAPELPQSGKQVAYLGAAFALYGLATALRSERWLALLRVDDPSVRRADAYALTLVGFMGNNVLPARGGDALRVGFLVPRSSIGVRGIVGTLVAERLLDVGTLLMIFVAVAYGALGEIDRPDTWVVVAIVLATIAVLAVILMLSRLEPGTGRGGRLVGFLAPMTEATTRLHGSHGLRMGLNSLAIWTVEALTYLAAARSVGLDVSLLESLYLIGLASLFVLIPSGPGYAGTLDAALAFGLAAIDAPGGQAVAFLITLRLVLFAPTTFAGAAVLVGRYAWRPGGRPDPGRTS